MIVQYRVSNQAVNVAEPGNDAGLITAFTQLPTFDVLVIADDSNVLSNPQTYYVTPFPTPTAVALQRIIQLTPSSNPIELNETPTISVQLKESNGTTNLNEVHTIDLVVNNGILSVDSVVTNGSGQASFSYSPSKTSVAMIRATSTTFHDKGIGITINTPTTPDQRSWIEGTEIKNDALVSSKLNNKQLIRVPGFSTSWFANKASLVQTFDPGLYSKMNTIVADDMGFIYVNGFQTVAENDPAVVKLDKNTGSVIATKPYTTYNLSSRFDGMCYDGTNIWVAGANHLYKIDALDMTTITDYTPGGATDGNFQFLLWDGEFIWTQLRGGTHADKDKVWKINPDGTVASTIDYRTSDPVGTAARDIKQAAADEDYIYVTGTGASVADWVRIKRSDESLTYRNEGDLYGAFGIAIAEFFHHIYVGGGSAGGETEILLEDTDHTPHTILLKSNFSQCYDLVFDGRYMWAITSSGTGSAPRRYVRKVFNDFDGGTLTEKQNIDLTVALDPTSLTFSPPHLYVAGYGSGGDSRIKKIFVGN